MQELATGFGLIEAPVWQPGTGLYFSDVLNGGVHLLRSDGDVSLIVAIRKGVGGMALHQAGGLVMGGRDICFFPFEDASPKSWLKISSDPKHRNSTQCASVTA